MLVAAMLLPFASHAQLTYNFEDNAIPTGWDNDASHPWVVTATSQTDASGNTHNGSYCIMSGNAGISSSTSTISATFTFVEGGSISFYGGCWGEGTSTAWDKCIFKIDGVQQFANGALDTWATYTYTVSAGMHIFEWIYSKDGSVNPTGDAFYIDDVVITGGQAPTCFNVQNLTLSAVTTSSMTLSWVDTINTGATYTVYDMSDTTAVNVTIVNNTAVIDGLDANTAYTFGVQPDCGGGDYAGYATISGRTSCAAIANLPYTMGFEADDLQGTTNALRLPWCWSRYASGNGSYTYYPYSNSSYVHEGSRALYFYCGTGTSYPDTQVVVLPELDVNTYPMSANRVTFWARMSSASYSNLVYVGTMTDPTDINTFVLVDTVRVSGATHTLYSVPLTTATGAYLAILSARNTTGNGYLALDDLTLEEMPSCLEVSNVAVVDSLTTANSITITWADTQNPDGTTYTVYNMADTSNVNATITDNVAVIENLDADAQYLFGVQANCAAGDANFMTVSARTACATMSMPWSENFDNWTAKSPCWSFMNGAYNGGHGTPSTYASAWTLNSSYGSHITIMGKALTMNLYSTNKYWAMTPSIEITDDALFTVDLAAAAWSDATPNYDDNDSLVVAITTNNGASFTTLQVLTQNDLNALTGTYTTLYVPVTGYTGETVRFVVYGGSTGGTSPYDNRMVIDNFSVSALTGDICYPVTNLTVSGITEDGATLTWIGNAASYNVYTIDGTDTTLYQNVTDTAIVLTNLTPMTSYTFGVRSVCGSDESTIATVSFSTACTAITLPYTETFEATSGTIGCWSVEGNGSWGIGTGDYSSSTGAYEGNTNARITHGTTGSATKLVSPVLDGVEDGMVLDFAYVMRSWAGDLDELRVYTRSSDTATWQMAAEYTDATTTWTVESLILPGTIYQVAFEFTDNYGYGLGIDSVVFTEMGGDYCFPVTGLTVDTATATSVTLSWSDANNSGATYSVYGADGTVIASGIADTTYTVTGLTALTNYTFGVAANCSATSTSPIATIYAVTSCAGTTCEINIYAEDGYGDGWNGAILAMLQNGAAVAAYSMDDMGGEDETVYDTAIVEVCASAPVSFLWIAGSYDDEISFTIADANGSTLYAVADASDLTDNAVFYSATTPCGTTIDSINVTIAVNDATMGTTNPAPGTYQFAEGTELTVSAIANDGYHFSGWRLQIPMLNIDTTATEGVLDSYTDTVDFLWEGVVITAIFEANPIDVPEATIDASDILYWVGEGSNEAIMAINWADTALAWGYRFNGDNVTILEMMDDIFAADSRITYSVDNDGYINSFVFVDGDETIVTVGGFWEMKHNGSTWSGMTSTLSNGDFVKWANSNAGVVVDSFYYEGYGWFYNYNYPMEIHPVSEPVIVPDTVTITFAVNDATMGSITPSGVQTYVVGDILTVTATPNQGYRLAAWQMTLDGQTFTETENLTLTYSDTVIADIDGAIITAVFEVIDGIDDVEAGDFKAYSVDNRIVVNGVENMNVNIYDVTGRVVYNETKAAEAVEFTVPSAGVYMVKVGVAPAKRVVVVR